LHDKVIYLIAFTGLIILAKFAAGFIYFKGNVVDSFVKFFSFYSASNIQMTESNGGRILKRVNNVANVIIYLLVIAFFTFYYIYPHIPA